MSTVVKAGNDEVALQRLLADLAANRDGLGRHRIVRRDHPTHISPDPRDEPVYSTEIPFKSFGPFIDHLGRLVHVDLILAATLIGVQFAGQSQPFMYFSVDPLPTGTVSSLPVAVDGSTWIVASKLTSAAPAGFVGLRIARGIIAFSTSLPVNVNPIIVPTSTTVTATLTLHPEAVTPPGVPGSNVTTPLDVRFTFSSTTGGLASADDGALQAFGYKVILKHRPGPAQVQVSSNQLSFPFTSDKPSFTIVDPSSEIVTFSGTAVSSSAWSLPITNVLPANLGQASGSGGMLLNLLEGLKMLPVDRKTPIECGKCAVFVQPNSVTIIGSSAVTPKRPHITSLWDQSTLTLRTPNPSLFRYLSNSEPSENWAITGNIVVALSQPRTIDDAGFRVSNRGSLVLSRTKSGGVQLDAIIPVGRVRDRLAYALKNVLLNLTGPLSVRVASAFKSGELISGKVFIPFQMNFGIPFLPDPYTYSGSIDPPTGPGSNSALITLTWPATPVDPLIPVVIDVEFNIRSDAPSGLPSFLGGEIEHKRKDTATTLLGPPGLTLLDLSTNLSQFGVAYIPRREDQQRLSVKDLYLQSSARSVNVVTLPAVQWEPLVTPNTDPTGFPSLLTYPNSGPMTQFVANSVTLTPLAPRHAIDGLLSAFHSPFPVSIDTSFTLPFGLEATGNLQFNKDPTVPKTDLNQVQPRFSSRNWVGGDQLSITITPSPFQQPPAPLVRSPVIPGAMRQVDIASPAGKKALDPINPDDTFAQGPNAGVPISRVDISGFGESTFSDWRDPIALPATISKVEFGVIVGRTTREVVQEFSVLVPYGVYVIRTIIIDRQNTGVVTRTDTGWRAASDGDYKALLRLVVTHPGVVLGATGIKNIRDTGQVFKGPAGSEFMAVVFDCFVRMENVVTGGGPDGVPAINQLGYVVTAPPRTALQPAPYAALLAAAGPLGGRIDCTINIGNSGLLFRVSHVGIGATSSGGTNPPEFAMAIWGTPVLPGGGQWSIAQMKNSGTTPESADRDFGIPLVRNSPVHTPGPFTTPYRFAAPADLLSTGRPPIVYGIMHSTGTQRLLFLQPKVEVSGPQAFSISSNVPPILADPAVLATSTGIFPRLDLCIEFNNNSYRLLIKRWNNLTLVPAASFQTKAVGRVIRDSRTVRSIAYTNDIAGNPSVVNLSIDTAAPVPWSLKITKLGSAFESGSLGEVMRIVGTIVADAKTPARMEDAEVIWGGCLEPVVKALTFFNGFGPLTPLDISMTNQWSYQAGLEMDLKGFEKEYPIIAKILGKFVKQFRFGIVGVTNPTATSLQMNYDVVIMVPIGTGFAVGFGKMRVFFKTLATTGTAVPNTGIVELEVGVGWGLDFPLGTFKAYAFAVLAVVIIGGPNTFGVGIAIILRGAVDLGPVTLQITSELKGMMIWQSCTFDGKDDKSVWAVAQATISVDITIFLIVNIHFAVQYEWVKAQDNDHCPLPQLPI